MHHPSLICRTWISINQIAAHLIISIDTSRTASETVELVKDVFVTVGERDIYTGGKEDFRRSTVPSSAYKE